MINWNYEYVEPNSFEPIPAGEHRVRIEKAELKKSKTGKDMIEMVLEISGYNSKIWHYIVFDPTNPRMTNQNLSAIYDSFDIEKDNLFVESWKGKVGAAKTKHDEYQGQITSRVHYFIPKKEQGGLPQWGNRNDGSSLPSLDGDDIQF